MSAETSTDDRSMTRCSPPPTPSQPPASWWPAPPCATGPPDRSGSSSSSTSSTSPGPRPAPELGRRPSGWSPDLPAMPSGGTRHRRARRPAGALDPPRSGRGRGRGRPAGRSRDHAAPALGPAGFGTAPLGTDPARPLQRVNPGARYVAMERHLTALGQGDAGRAMMAGTAALQVNLDAGPESGWARRLRPDRATSPRSSSRSPRAPHFSRVERSGWRSMRQQAWQGIDAARTATGARRGPPRGGVGRLRPGRPGA